MNKVVPITLSVALVLSALVTPAWAGRGAVYYSYGTYVTKIADLAETTSFNQAVLPSLGWRHERFAIFGMPLWGTTEGSYVLYTEAGDGWRMVPLPNEYLKVLGAELNINLNEQPPISMFSILWGWLILGPVMLLGIAGHLGKAGQRRRNNAAAPNQADIDELFKTAQKMSAQAPQKPQANATHRGPGQNGAPLFGKRRSA